MDEYKFVDPSTVKAFKLPEGFKVTPPKLPVDWDDKGADGQQKITAKFSAWVTTILINSDHTFILRIRLSFFE